jgi:hypothetical protein
MQYEAYLILKKMLKKNIDLRVEMLSYLNEDNKLEYYPSCGFPLEVFVINQYAPVNIYTKENLNQSNFLFYTTCNYTQDLAITLKKLIFVGTYSLLDQFSFETTIGFNSIIFKNYSVNSIVAITIFISLYLDIKVIQLQKINNNKKIFSLSRIFSNAT